MKTLAQYLADYIETEICRTTDEMIIPSLAGWIREGMAAYMSTENCEIIIQPRVS